MTENRQSDIVDPLSTVLRELNVESTLYFQRALTMPWSVSVHQVANAVRFHIVQSGHCYVRLHSNNESFFIEQGDIFLISQGESHTIYSNPSAEAYPVDFNQVLHSNQYFTEQQIKHGRELQKALTRIVCGHYVFNEGINSPLLNALPTILHRKKQNDDFSVWLEETLDLCASRDNSPLPHSEIVIIKTAEIALTLTIRMHLEDSIDFRSKFLRSINEKH